MEETRSSDTSETLLQDSSELLKEFTARCWQDSGSGCRQVVLSLYRSGHLKRHDAIDVVRQ
eukprot:15004953-Alexandrium_andersonii.AAC.1